MNVASPVMELHQKNAGGNERIAGTMFRYFRFPKDFPNFVYLSQIQQGLAAYQATGATRDRPYYLALLAEASAKVGLTTEGLEALAKALATLAKSGVPWWEAELYRLRGELLLLSADNEAAAEVCFHQDLDLAPRRQARSLCCGPP